MPSLFSKLTQFARSRQGRQAIEQAKRFARDPRRQQQAKDMLGKLRNRGKGPNPPRGY